MNLSSDNLGELIKKTQNKEVTALAKLLTQVDRMGPRCLKSPELLSPPNNSLRMGITGPPGAGKSTIIAGLIRQLRAQGLTIAVIAVDPSSPFTKGAILGDRIRYQEHSSDPGVFIRSIGTRGSLGGLCASAYLMLRAFDNFGFDVTLIETVGVGQTELEIVNVADEIAVVLVPESGDSIQAMKAGLLEITQTFVVNKSDRPGAISFSNELKSALELGNVYSETPMNYSIFQTTAIEESTLLNFTEWIIKKHDEFTLRSADFRTRPKLLQREALALLRGQYDGDLQKKAELVNTKEDLQNLFCNFKN